MSKPKILFTGMLPPAWKEQGPKIFARANFQALMGDLEAYDPGEIRYFSGFRPRPGFLKTLPNLKAIFSLGAGVDGFLRDPDFPSAVPLVKFVDATLKQEMAQYVAMHILIAHRSQHFFDVAQGERAWRQRMLERPTAATRVGIMGLGDIGQAIVRGLLPFRFPLFGWSRSRKKVEGVTSFAGAAELPQFLAQSDYCVCVLPLTDETRGILNAKLFAGLPEGARVINVARGGHLIEEDLVRALDSGHLAGAVLDVFQSEPLPKESPLWLHPKVTLTPHIAALTDPDAALKFLEDCVARCEAGRPLDHVVDVTKGY